MQSEIDFLMSDDERSGEEIPRATLEIDHNSFYKLLQLNPDCPWLVSESVALVELWNLCESEPQRDLVATLFRRFEIVDSSKLKNLGKIVADKIAGDWAALPNKTRIVAVSDDFEADGSQVFLNSIKNKFSPHDGWSEKNFVNSIAEGRDQAKSGWTIILLDDFIGTGKTIRRKVEWFKDKLEANAKTDVVLKAIAIAGMEQSRGALDGLDVECFCPFWLPKGISGHGSVGERATAKSLMKILEDKLGKYFKGQWLCQFGYGRSEALFSVEAFNVPNNVFPVFWWPILRNKSPRKTVFSRLR